METEFDSSALDALHEFRAEDEPDPASFVIGLFLEDAPVRLGRVRAAIEAGDTDALREAAHALGGTASSVGALGLHSICVKIERLARAGTTAGALEYHAEALRAQARMIDRLREWKESIAGEPDAQ